MKIILTILFFLITLPAFAQDMQADLEKHFRDFNLVKLDKAEIVQKSKTNELVQVADFEFSISPRDLFIGLDEVKTFRGKLKGNPDSEIRLSVDENSVKGYIFDGENRFYIEPVAKFSNKASIKEHIIYKSKDRKDEQPFVCLVDDTLHEGLSMTSSKIGDFLSNGLKTVRVVEIATDADYEWVTKFGGAARANEEILSIINLAEGVFERQLGIVFSVTFQHAWATPDSYRAISMSYVSFDYENYWKANFSHIHRDVAYLFSDKPLVTGMAGPGAVCRAPQDSYGLVGWLNSPGGEFDSTRTWKVFAHEMGHNLNADHVVYSGECNLTIMNDTIYPLTAQRFCQTSIDQITNFVNNYGTCLQQITTNKTKFDFDGDGKSDISVFRRSNGFWYVTKSSSGYSFVKWGLATDRPVPADYDGDGQTDLAVYRIAALGSPDTNNTWYILRSSDNTVFIRQFGFYTGFEADVPVPADYDGDGKADLAIYHISDVSEPTYFMILQSSNDSKVVKYWGTTGDLPVPADYDGDGKADLAVYRIGSLSNSEGSRWFILQSSTDTMKVEYFGLSTDKLVPADYDGDGKADIAVWRPSNGVWYRLNSSDSSFVAIPFGLSEDKPTPADYDGDGKTDIAVFRPSTGIWYLLRSRDGFTALQFGLAEDVPIPNAYIR